MPDGQRRPQRDTDIELRRRQRDALRVALVVNAAFLVVEFVGGLAFHSLSLLADAAHMLSDVAALAIALTAQRLLARPATVAHTYGLQRAEVIAAQANGAILVLASVWIVAEATRRISVPAPVAGRGLLAVATLGLLANVGSAALIARVRGRSLNLHGALMHLVFDALGSIGAMGAGLAVVLWGATWVDPAVSILLAALVLWSAWELLRETVHVLLEGTPRGVDVREVERLLLAHPAVEAVHHLHVWSIASDVPALSAHVLITEDVTLHQAQMLGDELKAVLEERLGIEHATLELECHVCAPEAAGIEPHGAF